MAQPTTGPSSGHSPPWRPSRSKRHDRVGPNQRGPGSQSVRTRRQAVAHANGPGEGRAPSPAIPVSAIDGRAPQVVPRDLASAADADAIRRLHRQRRAPARRPVRPACRARQGRRNHEAQSYWSPKPGRPGGLYDPIRCICKLRRSLPGLTAEAGERVGCGGNGSGGTVML